MSGHPGTLAERLCIYAMSEPHAASGYVLAAARDLREAAALLSRLEQAERERDGWEKRCELRTKAWQAQTKNLLDAEQREAKLLAEKERLEVKNAALMEHRSTIQGVIRRAEYAEAEKERYEEALRVIASEDDLVSANEEAFSIHAFRRCQQVARAALAGDVATEEQT